MVVAIITLEGVTDVEGNKGVGILVVLLMLTLPKGTLPLKGLLLRPCCRLVQPGLCLLACQLSGSTPEPDTSISSGFSTEGVFTVGGEGKAFDTIGVAAVVEDLE